MSSYVSIEFVNICFGILILLIVGVNGIGASKGDSFCGDVDYRDATNYKLVGFKVKSKQAIISRTFASDLEKCKELAVGKKALALNYKRPQSRNNGRHSNSRERKSATSNDDNCQVLRCPETGNSTSLSKDIDYKYYSLYRNLSTPENASLVCVENAGMFVISRVAENFTEAQKVCRKMNASLAHVVSEERTQGLGRSLPTTNSPVFVGLSSRNEERIWKNEYGEPLSCFDFRAWDVQEPSHSRGCVALIRLAKSSLPVWKVFPCHAVLPFVCEVSPS